MHKEIIQAELKTIDQVLIELDQIIDETIENNNCLGIFAYVYRRTTAEILKAIKEKKFDDNIRMVSFDVAFASLYINAYHHYHHNQPVSLSWRRAFDYSRRKISILQHVLLGMNAHINLDLGVAAAYISDGKNINDLKHDFMLVNHILASLIDEIQLRLSRVSPLMFLMDWAGGRSDEQMISFNIIKARHNAWKVACTLARLPEDERRQKIEQVDHGIACLSYNIYQPNLPLVRWALKLIRLFEEKEVGRIIEKLERE